MLSKRSVPSKGIVQALVFAIVAVLAIGAGALAPGRASALSLKAADDDVPPWDELITPDEKTLYTNDPNMIRIPVGPGDLNRKIVVYRLSVDEESSSLIATPIASVIHTDPRASELVFAESIPLGKEPRDYAIVRLNPLEDERSLMVGSAVYGTDEAPYFGRYTGLADTEGNPVFEMLAYELDRVILDNEAPALAGGKLEVGKTGDANAYTRNYVTDTDSVSFVLRLTEQLSGIDKDSISMTAGGIPVSPSSIVQLERGPMDPETSFSYLVTLKMDENPALRRIDSRSIIDEGAAITLTVRDRAGNELVATRELDSAVKYVAKLELQSYEINTSGKQYLKVGDRINIVLHMSTLVDISQVEIFGRTVSVIPAVDDHAYAIFYTIPDSRALGALANGDTFSANIVARDVFGNELPISVGSPNPDMPITYLEPIELEGDIAFTSNNVNNGKYVKAGDTIQISFQPSNENAKLAEVLLFTDSTGPIPVTNNALTKTMTLDAATIARLGLKNEERITYTIQVRDEAGNVYESTCKDSNAFIYLEPIMQTGEVGAKSSRDSDKILNYDNTLIVNFTTTNAPVVSFVRLNGKKYELSQESFTVNTTRVARSEYSTVITIVPDRDFMGEHYDLKQVVFDVEMNDLAANGNIECHSSPNLEMIYVARLTVSNATIVSDNQKAYLKNGSSVTAEATTNHAATITANFSGTSLTSTASVTNPSVRFTIPAQESTMPEGSFLVSATVTDIAGNTVTLTDTEYIYDRTKPIITVEAGKRGYFNTSSSLTVTFADANLDFDNSAFMVNGENLLAKNRDSFANGQVTITASFVNDNRYKISIYGRDLAGNSSDVKEDFSIVIDRVAPVISLVEGFEMVGGKALTFQPGVRLSDLVTFSETPAEISVTKTEAGEVTKWSMNEPLVTEGMKDISIRVADPAGNVSMPFHYSLIIDGTAPVVEVSYSKPDGSKAILTSSSQVQLNTGNRINVRLQNRDDTFEVLEIVNDKNEVIKNFLADEKAAADGSYSTVLNVAGNYKLRIVARDNAINVLDRTVGNTTGFQVYGVEVLVAPPVPLPRSTSPVLWPFLVFGGLILAGGVGSVVYFGSKRKKKPQTNY